MNLHPVVVLFPLLAENIAFFLNLTHQVLAECEELVRKLLLKRIQLAVELCHLLGGLLTVLLNFPDNQRFILQEATYVYTFWKRCSSRCLEAIRAFFMSSKSWDMSFI